MNESILSAKFTFWNIAGIKSKIIGNKLTEPDFLSEVHKADIIGLTENHVHDVIIQDLHIMTIRIGPKMLDTILVLEVLQYLRKKIYRRYFNPFMPRTRT